MSSLEKLAAALNDVTVDLLTNTCPRDSYFDDDEDGTILSSFQDVTV